MSVRAFAALGRGSRRSAAAAWVRAAGDAAAVAAIDGGVVSSSRALASSVGPFWASRGFRSLARSLSASSMGWCATPHVFVASSSRSFSSRPPRRPFAPGGRARAEKRQATALERRARDLPPELLPVVVLLGRPNVGKSALFNRLTSGHRLRGAGRRGALVRDTPEGHVTRDYRESPAALSDLRFLVVDTCGLEASASPGSIAARSALLTRDALERADVALLLLDARAGVTSADAELATWIRRRASHLLETPGKLVVVANKAEGGDGPAAALEAEAELGLSDAVAVSATTGEGMADLFDKLAPALDPILKVRRAQWAREIGAAQRGEDEERGGPPEERGHQETVGADSAAAATAPGSAANDEAMGVNSSSTVSSGSGVQAPGELGDDWSEFRALERADVEVEDRDSPPSTSSPSSSPRLPVRDVPCPPVGAPVRLSILGVPNAGKSTLVNALLGSERCLTGPEPGLTRDAIQAVFERNGQRYLIADTAGWVRRARLAQHDEDGGGALTAASLLDRQEAMRHADVAVLVLDALRAAAAVPEEVERAKERAQHAMQLRAESLEEQLEAHAKANKEHDAGHGQNKARDETDRFASPSANVTSAHDDENANGADDAKDATIANATSTGITNNNKNSTGGRHLESSTFPPLSSRSPSSSLSLSSSSPPPLSEPPPRPPLGISHRELTLAAEAAQEGRAVVLAVNKLDALHPSRRKEVLAAVRADADRSLRDLGEVPIVGVSAVDERGLDALLRAVKVSRDAWERRVPASAVNAALAAARKDRERRGLGQGDAGTAALQRVKFAAMINTRPPTFALSASGTDKPTEAETRMLANVFRRAFQLNGCPIRLKFRLNEKRGRKK